jgi:hypothetical protein
MYRSVRRLSVYQSTINSISSAFSGGIFLSLLIAIRPDSQMGLLEGVLLATLLAVLTLPFAIVCNLWTAKKYPQ